MAQVAAMTFFAVECDLRSVLDLTDPRTRAALGLTHKELFGGPGSRGHSETQLLGERCAASGLFDGLLYEAAVRPGARCLVVFPDALLKLGSSVRLVGPVAFGDLRLGAPARPTTVALTREVLSIVALATEWFSGQGGLSTFNRDLCCALSRAGHRVCCIVPEVREEEAKAARAEGVRLASPDKAVGDENERLFWRPKLPWTPDVIIGHGRVTGVQAAKHVEDHYPSAKLVQFVHVAPNEI